MKIETVDSPYTYCSLCTDRKALGIGTDIIVFNKESKWRTIIICKKCGTMIVDSLSK